MFSSYKDIALAVDSFIEGKTDETLKLLTSVHANVRTAFKYFGETLNEGVIMKKYWLPYAQGFHGWGLDGEGGPSGNQAFMINVLDTLLNFEYNSPVAQDSMAARNRLPKRMNYFLVTLKAKKFREITKDYPKIQSKLKDLVTTMKVNF